MEAVPRLPMLGLELKISPDNPAFGPKLKQYIAECYHEDAESYNNEIHQLEGLRSAAVRPAIDLTGCVALKRYFCQLRGLQSRFPMSKGQPAAVSFAWRDLFANIVCNLADIRFEMVCVLYNIGALHCKLGAAESRVSTESMKAACNNFQSAAWAFQHLKEHYPQPASVDLSPDIMKLFQDICLGQAQECILEKSMQDNRKPAIVCAIGQQAIQHYKNAISVLETSQNGDALQETVGLKTCISWFKMVFFKLAYLGAIVNLFQGMQSEEQQKMGERVAFYQLASEKLKLARKRSKGLSQIEAVNEALTFTNDVVEGKRKAAKNENEFIYHEEVPDKELLVDPKPASLAEGIQINFNDPEVSGPDIFGRLVPMRAHEASSMYSEEKAKLLRRVCGGVEMKDSHLNDFMSSLQLDELNVLNDTERLPTELVDICAALSVKTDAIKELVESMNTLADIHTEVEGMFTEIKSLIEEEENSEKEFQQIMGKRPPSNVSTELSREANKYLEAHNKANDSNQTLHKAMTLHLANLKLLSLPLEELEKHLPSVESIKPNIDNAAVAEMRSLVEKVNEMRAQRSMFVLQLREAVNSDDITSQLLTRTGETLDEIFKQEIEKHNKLVSLIDQNMLAQENILKALTDAYAKYAPSRKIISDILRKKESFFTAMTTSFETYDDLMKKSTKGIEFYRKLSSTVSRLLSRLKSICKVQQEERSQLLATNTQKQVQFTPTKVVSSVDTAARVSAPVSNVNTTKEEATPGPKLKDYLPYMKNRGTSQQPAVVSESSAVDSSYAGQLYPPYVRPAPVGSEGSNEPLPSKYFDSSVASKQAYISDYENQKSFQLPQADAYNAQQYSEQMTYPYNTTINPNPTLDPKMYPQTYGYNTNMPTENVNTNYGVENYSNVKPNVTPNQNYGNMQSAPQLSPYNQSSVNYSATNTPNYSVYDATYQNQINTSVQQDPYYQNQQGMQGYTNFTPQVYPDPSQNDQNKLATQMQNMNISYSMPNQTSQNAYGNMYTANTYDMSMQYQNVSSQPNVYTNIPETPNVAMQNFNTIPAENLPTVNPDIPNPIQICPTPYSMHSYASANVNQQNPINQTVTPTDINYSNSNQNLYNAYNQNLQSDPNAVYQSQTVNTPLDSAISSHSQFTNYACPPEVYSVQPQNIPNASVANTENTTVPQIPSDSQTIQSHVHKDFLPNNAINMPSISNYNAQYDSMYSNNEINTGNSNAVNNPQNYTQTPNPNMTDSNLTSYQNHPGYGYNDKTGVYDYNYGYQNSTNNTSQDIQNVNYPSIVENNTQNYLYTNAGTYGTVQSSSENDQGATSPIPNENGHYYSVQYGYQRQNEAVEPVNNNNINQNSIPNDQQNVNNQANGNNLTYMNSKDSQTTTTYSAQGKTGIKSSSSVEDTAETPTKTEEKPICEPSTIDLLSGLDFNIEHTPLMPEIRVPSISEQLIRKVVPKEIMEDCSKAECAEIMRPPKRDLFSDPSLVNKFTQEVKSMQIFVDGLTKKTHSGITMLDSKWKKIQDNQAKENHSKTTNDAKDNIKKNASPDVLTYDDSRVQYDSEFSNSYTNASFVKQISSWCVPIIISDLPYEENYSDFWHLVYQQKVSVMVCLLTEIELQGKFYGPTSKTHVLEFSSGLSVTLDEIVCNVNWTMRKLIIKFKNNQHKIMHYQMNVFPARIVSAPLVMLVDKILNTKDENNLNMTLPKMLVHCNTGAGRSSLIVLLTMVMCQIRAGFIDLREMLDAGFSYLCGVRTNVLEDTKYLVDIYRTVLFYVQGVLCSGNVMFNGEIVSVPSGASIPPPHITSHFKKSDNLNKFTKESFEEMKQAAGLKSGDMQDPLSYLDPLWNLKKRKD